MVYMNNTHKQFSIQPSQDMTFLEKTKLAREAMSMGMTRGQFIRDCTSSKSTIKECQVWSDAYTCYQLGAK